MTGPALAAQLLGRIDDDGFNALLHATEAPDAGFASIGLLDLASHRRHAVGNGQATTAAEFAAALLGADAATATPVAAETGPQPFAVRAQGHIVVVQPGHDCHTAVAIRPGAALNLATLRDVHDRVCAGPPTRRPIDAMLHPAVLRIMRVDAANGAIIDSHPVSSNGSRQPSIDPAALGATLSSLLLPGPNGAEHRSVITAGLLDQGQRALEFVRVPFIPQLVVAAEIHQPDPDRPVLSVASQTAEHVLRNVIGRILADGLHTDIHPFPDTDVEFQHLVAQLRDVEDLDSKLIIGGFADHPVEIGTQPMRCQECIYYASRRRWCELPELPLPVEPQWFCRLWKI